ncbi:Uncharacterized protein DAT39_003138, partial [Clarias magur]
LLVSSQRCGKTSSLEIQGWMATQTKSPTFDVGLGQCALELHTCLREFLTHHCDH